jgi:hypothetical protein
MILRHGRLAWPPTFDRPSQEVTVVDARGRCRHLFVRAVAVIDRVPLPPNLERLVQQMPQHLLIRPRS